MSKPRNRVKGSYIQVRSDAAVCIYCGMPSEELDHALPYKFKDSPIGAAHVLVPACTECNRILSASVQETLGGRIREAKRRLAGRYKKILKIPHWTPEDIGELSENLRGSLLRDLLKKKRIMDRIAFDYFLWEKLGRPESLLP